MLPILSISDHFSKNIFLHGAISRIFRFFQKNSFIYIAIPPSLLPTISFIGGIALHTVCKNPLFFYTVALLTIILGTLSIYSTYKKTVWKLFIIVCHMLIGSATMQKHQNAFISLRNLAYITDWRSSIGTITDIEEYSTPYRTYCYMLSCLVPIAHTHLKIPMHIKMSMQKPLYYGVGDTLLINNVIFKQQAPSTWQERTGIIGALRVSKETTIKCLAKGHNSLLAYAYNQRSAIYENIRKKLKGYYFNILSILFFGKKNQKNTYKDHILKQKHQIWGISHYLARSGLHCTLNIALWELLLSIIPLPFYIRQSTLLLLLGLYSILSWLSVSFMRAACMSSLLLLSKIQSLQLYSMHIICCITYIFLLYNPIYLFCIDFQLSFATTFILSWISHLEQHKKKNL